MTIWREVMLLVSE